MPYYSIIIPTYNSEKTIKQCLDSILSQTFRDFEILIMDNLSNDNTISIITEYDDSRIKIYSAKDNGVYDAMNKGIDQSSGDWLYFLGSDDSLYDNLVFEKVSAYIFTNQVDLIYGNSYFIHSKVIYNGKYDRLKLLHTSNICHQSIFYKRDLFYKLGKYNVIFPIYADWDFNLRCFSNPDLNIKYIDIIISRYNDASGISNQGVTDHTFKEYYGLYYKDFYDYLKESLEYKVGSKIISPLKKIKNFFF